MDTEGEGGLLDSMGGWGGGGGGGGCGPLNYWPTTLFSEFSHTTWVLLCLMSDKTAIEL